MKLRTRLNLVLIGLTAVSVGVLIVDELHDMRSSIREEIEAANRVAAHLLGSLALTDSSADGLAAVREQLQKLGHVRANDIRSEERRVGKECRSRRERYPYKKNTS